jgi:pSer/pThr/pTyr-binding forkhead associated (FHA) protein
MIKIKDLNSTNGTFVNGKRVENESVVKGDDVIRVGNFVVDWIKYLNEKESHQPTQIHQELTGVKIRKTIGRNQSNDLVINRNDVSSQHAQLVLKESGEVVISDNGSTNGTYVNGQRTGIKVLVKGDKVLIANKYPVDWESTLSIPSESGNKMKGKTKILVMAVAVAVLAVIVFLLFTLPGEKKWEPQKIYALYKKSVVMIYGSYYYEVSAKGRILANVSLDDQKQLVKFTGENPITYTATGFFVSGDGKIMTNRHVVLPWEYDDGVSDKVKEYFQKHLAELSLSDRSSFTELQPLISDVVVQGKLADLGIFLNDSYITSIKDIIPCSYIKDSGQEEVDLGLIQVNSKSLPPGIERVVDLSIMDTTEKASQIGSNVYTIGFPSGFSIGNTKAGIEANNQSGEITQVRGEIEFGHNISITHGASGSPVFNDHGQLVGVVNAGFVGISQGYNMAVKARFAVELLR